jgi:hypothetical protein
MPLEVEPVIPGTEEGEHLQCCAWWFSCECCLENEMCPCILEQETLDWLFFLIYDIIITGSIIIVVKEAVSHEHEIGPRITSESLDLVDFLHEFGDDLLDWVLQVVEFRFRDDSLFQRKQDFIIELIP